jgi:hypothetical protein
VEAFVEAAGAALAAVALAEAEVYSIVPWVFEFSISGDDRCSKLLE